MASGMKAGRQSEKVSSDSDCEHKDTYADQDRIQQPEYPGGGGAADEQQVAGGATARDPPDVGEGHVMGRDPQAGVVGQPGDVGTALPQRRVAGVHSTLDATVEGKDTELVTDGWDLSSKSKRMGEGGGGRVPA
jgi:hypothetical protein